MSKFIHLLTIFLKKLGYGNMNNLEKISVTAKNEVESMRPLIGALMLIFGIGLILFSNWGGGINAANIILGLLLGIFGVSISLSGRNESSPNSEREEITQSSKENKRTFNNHVTIVEEVVTRKVKDENM